MNSTGLGGVEEIRRACNGTVTFIKIIMNKVFGWQKTVTAIYPTLLLKC
jgi:hypothetical protein